MTSQESMRLEDKLIRASSMLSMLGSIISPLDYTTGKSDKPPELDEDARFGFSFTLDFVKDAIDETLENFPAPSTNQQVE